MDLEQIGNFAQIPKKCVYFSITNHQDLKISPSGYFNMVVAQLFQLACLKVQYVEAEF